MKILSVLGLVCLLSCGWAVKDVDVITSIEKQGYTNVAIITRYNYWIEAKGCSSDNSVAHVLSATSPTGRTVVIIACSGIPFEGVTIRVK
jgi:hypothetical protein